MTQPNKQKLVSEAAAVDCVRTENLEQHRVNGSWMWCCTEDCIETLYTTPQPDRTAQLQEQVLQLQDKVKRLVEALRGANELFHSMYGANLPPPIEVIRVAQCLEEIGGER